MKHRERYVRCLTGKPVDRPPYWLLWSPWKTTRARWESEGMPGGYEDHRDLFDVDPRPKIVPVNYGPCPSLERAVEEDEEFILYYDSWGIKRRDFKHHESMSEFIEFPVKNREDWEQFRDEHLDPDNPDRFPENWKEQCIEWNKHGIPLMLCYWPNVGLYACLRWLLGDEDCLLAFYTMPGLVRDILDHLSMLYLTLFERILKEDIQVDVIHMFEDLCGRQGPLISPRHWKEFFSHHYRSFKDCADRYNIPLFSVDTDGMPYLLIKPMMEAGVNYMWPFEVAAGCDVNEVRENYPSLAMMGGIDKRALAIGPDAIEVELERVRPVVESGRYIPETDHSIPDDVSWDNYRYFADRLRKLTGK